MESSFTFVGHSFDKQTGKATFSYKLTTSQKTYAFTETVLFPVSRVEWNNVSEEAIKTNLDNLLLILGISYWKLLCPKNIQLQTISLNHEQAIFWETVYTKGLGEFFYKNNIDFIGLVRFPFDQNNQ